jgi:hypothetical protein
MGQKVATQGAIIMTGSRDIAAMPMIIMMTLISLPRKCAAHVVAAILPLPVQMVHQLLRLAITTKVNLIFVTWARQELFDDVFGVGMPKTTASNHVVIAKHRQGAQNLSVHRILQIGLPRVSRFQLLRVTSGSRWDRSLITSNQFLVRPSATCCNRILNTNGALTVFRGRRRITTATTRVGAKLIGH